LVVAGEVAPSLHRALVSLIDRLGIADSQILFIGHQPRAVLANLYSNSTALLVPLEDNEQDRSRFPTKIAEYLASRRPVITTAVGDIPRYFTNGRNAFVTSPHDEIAFASRIQLAASDEVLATRVGEAGYRVAQSEFHYATQGRRLATFMNALLARDYHRTRAIDNKEPATTVASERRVDDPRAERVE
jgi:glycosyltransferase involved in cell wall biosynthesis